MTNESDFQKRLRAAAKQLFGKDKYPVFDGDYNYLCKRCYHPMVKHLWTFKSGTTKVFCRSCGNEFGNVKEYCHISS